MALYSGYTGAKTCTRGPQPGARGFMSWFLAKYVGIGGQNSGIYNCRPVRGSTRTTSLHGEGRGVDLGLKFARKEFAVLAEQLRLHSKELGIQCIIYNRKIFSGGYEDKGWHRYTGVNPHTDHLHVEMAWWSAQLSADEYIALLEKTIGHKLAGTPGDVAPAGKPSTPKPPAKPATKSVATMASEVIAGKHGAGHDARRKSLRVSAAVYEQVRAEVNRRAGIKTTSKPAGKSINTMASEVIAGKHGTGHANRQKSLGVNAATYAKVRATVNRKA